MIIIGAVVFLAALIVQRVLPPARVWLFLFPIFLMGASKGLMTGLESMMTRVKMKGSMPYVILVFAATLFLGVTRYMSSEKLGASAIGEDAIPIARLLTDSMELEDRLLLRFPAEAPVEFYLIQNSVQIKAYTNNDSTFKRIWFVVLEATGPQKESMIALLKEVCGPVVKYTGKRATLYRIHSSKFYDCK